MTSDHHSPRACENRWQESRPSPSRPHRRRSLAAGRSGSRHCPAPALLRSEQHVTYRRRHKEESSPERGAGRDAGHHLAGGGPGLGGHPSLGMSGERGRRPSRRHSPGHRCHLPGARLGRSGAHRPRDRLPGRHPRARATVRRGGIVPSQWQLDGPPVWPTSAIAVGVGVRRRLNHHSGAQPRCHRGAAHAGGVRNRHSPGRPTEAARVRLYP